jgi:AcrR family transcriptional regulator
MTASPQPSARREELLERAYRHVLQTGLADMSLRPLAEAVGSSPRVLLFLFGSKDGLVRALLARARQEELALLRDLRRGSTQSDLRDVTRLLWRWLSAPEHQRLLTLWTEGYARAIVDPASAWSGFAEQTVRDWLALLAEHQPVDTRHTEAGLTQRTLVLAVLRGALLDLLATGDLRRTTVAIDHQLALLIPR